MHLLSFINSHEDWEKLLGSAPYNLNIKWLNKYFICNYNMIESDFHYMEVQEARGSIFKWNEKLKKAKYVCHPFDKFFNYGEELAADIDWTTARVTEKVDGSLMKVWWQDARWHLSTNGTIDAFSAPVADFGITFGELFEKALGYTVEELGKSLNRMYTYCFELTAPESRVVIGYDAAVWFLTAFTKDGGVEILNPPILENVKYPKVYDLTSLDEVLEVVNAMDRTHEGVVVSDLRSHRIKVKSPEYLIAAHLHNNGAVTKKKILEYIYAGQIDDFIAYCPQYQTLVNNVKEKLCALAHEIDAEYDKIISGGVYEQKKDFALVAKNYRWKAYHFIKYGSSDKDYTASKWLSELTLQKLADLIGE